MICGSAEPVALVTKELTSPVSPPLTSLFQSAQVEGAERGPVLEPHPVKVSMATMARTPAPIAYRGERFMGIPYFGWSGMGHGGCSHTPRRAKTMMLFR